MDDSVGLAPPVESILASAASRQGPDERVTVESRSLGEAFQAARSDGRVPVIAEVKPTSPTADYDRSVDPVAVASEMEAAGAAAISVLTEPTHFGGSVEALEAVRSTVSVPVLRKDFILEPSQLDMVVTDVVLLIARFLDDLPDMVGAARSRGMQPLVEVHTAAEREAALDAGATIVGINNRDLGRLEVDRSVVESLAPDVPEDRICLAESGIETPEHARRMLSAGADGLLIGSAIMDGDVRTNTERFVHA